MNPEIIEIPAGPVWHLAIPAVIRGAVIVLSPETAVFCTYRLTGDPAPPDPEIWESQRLTALEADIYHDDPIDIYFSCPDGPGKIKVYR